ncbi:hypothetical protein C8F01DRAFT_1129335 [Mycena amicta]|nr:hypothetical protein C8F01DRAFT_1129335 [Mycena amicta]
MAQAQPEGSTRDLFRSQTGFESSEQSDVYKLHHRRNGAPRAPDPAFLAMRRSNSSLSIDSRSDRTSSSRRSNSGPSIPSTDLEDNSADEDEGRSHTSSSRRGKRPRVALVDYEHSPDIQRLIERVKLQYMTYLLTTNAFPETPESRRQAMEQLNTAKVTIKGLESLDIDEDMISLIHNVGANFRGRCKEAVRDKLKEEMGLFILGTAEERRKHTKTRVEFLLEGPPLPKDTSEEEKLKVGPAGRWAHKNDALIPDFQNAFNSDILGTIVKLLVYGAKRNEMSLAQKLPDFLFNNAPPPGIVPFIMALFCHFLEEHKTGEHETIKLNCDGYRVKYQTAKQAYDKIRSSTAGKKYMDDNLQQWAWEAAKHANKQSVGGKMAIQIQFPSMTDAEADAKADAEISKRRQLRQALGLNHPSVCFWSSVSSFPATPPDGGPISYGPIGGPVQDPQIVLQRAPQHHNHQPHDIPRGQSSQGISIPDVGRSEGNPHGLPNNGAFYHSFGGVGVQYENGPSYNHHRTAWHSPYADHTLGGGNSTADQVYGGGGASYSGYVGTDPGGSSWQQQQRSILSRPISREQCPSSCQQQCGRSARSRQQRKRVLRLPPEQHGSVLEHVVQQRQVRWEWRVRRRVRRKQRLQRRVQRRTQRKWRVQRRSAALRRERRPSAAPSRCQQRQQSKLALHRQWQRVLQRHRGTEFKQRRRPASWQQLIRVQRAVVRRWVWWEMLRAARTRYGRVEYAT